MNIEVLIKEARQGSTAAEKCLFDLYAGKMLMVCRRYVKVPEDAEEIMLDGLYKFLKSIHSFNYQGDAALFTWLKRLMVNECLMFLRKKKAFIIVTDAEAKDIPLPAEALNNLSASEIFELIVQLPVGYRTVFNLFEVEGYSHKEIAALLTISEGTSKSQLSKAKNLLQKLLINNGNGYVRQQQR